MNKPELIDVIVQKTNIKKKDTEAVLESLIESIEETLKNGDKVTLVGFGTFDTRQRAGRKGINTKKLERRSKFQQNLCLTLGPRRISKKLYMKDLPQIK